jgi:hypothetical protein
VVAQIDEQHAAVVALAMDPAGQANSLAAVGLGELATGVTAISVHVWGLLLKSKELGKWRVV